METGLANRVVVVTAATANIGRGIAMAFAKEGSRIVIVGRDEAQGPRVAQQALELGAAEAHWMPADVVSYEQVEALADRVLKSCGGADVLVNGVGGNVDIRPFVDSTPDQWRADIDINMISTLNCTKLFLPHMISRSWGRIINVGSMSAIIGDEYLAVYSAMKAGVHGFTRVLAKEVGQKGITVNTVSPYSTLPDDPEEGFSTGSRRYPGRGIFVTQTAEQAALRRGIFRPGVLPQQRAKASQVGAAAVYFASDAAAYVTGEVICLDGGRRLA